jgi:hypothetical protein
VLCEAKTQWSRVCGLADILNMDDNAEIDWVLTPRKWILGCWL